MTAIRTLKKFIPDIAKRALSWVVFTGLLLTCPRLGAHPISMLRAEAVIHRDQLEVQIRVMPEDFLYAYGILANGQARIATNDIASSAEKHKPYLLDGLVIHDADGNQLTGRVAKVEMPVLPAEGLPVTDLMATTIVYHLEYQLAKPPTYLTFKQHFGGEGVLIPPMVEFQVTREGLPPEPQMRLPRSDFGVTIPIDWAETAQSPTNYTAAQLARQEKQREQNMGIASYSATYPFIYILNEEVRVEILIPLLTLETWQPVAHTNADFLEVAEQQAARKSLETFFTEQNELKIDGILVKPTLSRLDFYGVDFKDFALQSAPQRVSTWTARVGAILTYSTKGAPHHVEFKWTLFNRQMPAASAAVFAYDQGMRFLFSPAAPVFKWDNPGASPLPPANAVSAGEKSRAAVAESLLRNVYRAFDYHTDSDTYDALANSVSGDLLSDLYLKIKHGLIMQEQGGSQARVEAVKIIKNEPLESQSPGGFAERVTWQVAGTVEHWGHIHRRVNEYAADFEIEPVAGNWKITALNIIRQNQVEGAVILRKL